MAKINKKNTIRNYSILLLVIIFLIGFAIVNRSNDGELNDYETYTPEVIVNEINGTNQTLDDLGFEQSVESIIYIALLMGVLAMVGIIVFGPLVRSGYVI